MRGSEVGDLQRPRLIASDVGAEAGKRHQPHRLDDQQADQDEDHPAQVLVFVFDERKQQLIDLVQHQPEQDASADDADEFSAGAASGRRRAQGRHREDEDSPGCPVRLWRLPRPLLSQIQ